MITDLLALIILVNFYFYCKEKVEITKISFFESFKKVRVNFGGEISA